MMHTLVAASLDRNNLINALVDRIATDRLTSTIMRTVGSVLAKFAVCGGRTHTGTMPVSILKQQHHS
jgi:hypothetical protein